MGKEEAYVLTEGNMAKHVRKTALEGDYPINSGKRSLANEIGITCTEGLSPWI